MFMHERMPGSTSTFSDADLSINVNQRIRNAWNSSRKYTLKLYDLLSGEVRASRRVYTGGESCGAHGDTTAEVRDVQRVGGGRGLRDGGDEKEWVGCLLDDLRALASTPTSGGLQPRTRGNGAGLRDKERNVS